MPVLFATSRTLFLAALAIAILATGHPAAACGPGRSGSRRRTPRKLTPLVFKQHVPNVEEFSISASGPPEGKITPNDPRFKQLVPNYNADVIFRDEEGNGEDRLMSPRCKEKLNTLAISVMNMFPGVRLRVTEGYDEEGFHSVQSLHYEGRALDITTSDKDRSKYGMLARLAVEAGFDFVFYESRSHIHLSCKSEKSADAAKFGGCFPPNAIVQTARGEMKMSELRPGHKVLVTKPDGSLYFSEVLLFLDREETQPRLFYTLTTETNTTITLTPTHLLFVSEQRTTDIEHALVALTKHIRPGHFIFVKSNRSEEKVRSEKVVDIQKSVIKGAYAPLTKEGTLVVDNVVASCYALLCCDQTLVHWFFFPVRVTDNAIKAVSHFLRSFNFVHINRTPKNNAVDVVETGIHWYPKLLYRLSKYLLPDRYLYQ